MRNWACATEKGFILARGIDHDEGIFLTWRADFGPVSQKLNAIEDAMAIAPTAHSIYYSNMPEPISNKNNDRYKPPKQGTSPSVCEILNRGD